MTTHDHAKALNSLLRSLRNKYDPIAVADRTPLEEFVYSFLLWEATTAKADAAYKRMVNAMVDFNEMRVSRVPELVALMGKTYPRAEERAQRMRAALNEVYVREFAVTLDPCAGLSKREARKYLESLDGCPSFVAARVLLLRMDGHALPVDDKLNARLIEAEVSEEDADPARTAGVIERHVKAEDALGVHLLLQAWNEDPATEAKKPRPKPVKELPKPEAKPKVAAKPAEIREVKPASKKPATGTKPKSKSSGKSSR
jgi:hypothetical protein